MGVKQDPVHMSQELTKPVDIIPELTGENFLLLISYFIPLYSLFKVNCACFITLAT